MILVGLGLGLIPRQWDRRVPATAALSVLLALAWGMLVGALIGGALFALANIAVGLPLGLGIQRLGYAVLRTVPGSKSARIRRDSSSRPS